LRIAADAGSAAIVVTAPPMICLRESFDMMLLSPLLSA